MKANPYSRTMPKPAEVSRNTRESEARDYARLVYRVQARKDKTIESIAETVRFRIDFMTGRTFQAHASKSIY